MPTLKDRSQADPLYQQANTAYQNGDYQGAQRFLDQSEQLKPNQADNWNLRGVIYLKQKDYDKAETAFARAAIIDPALWAAQFNLAEARFQKKDFARARTSFDHLLAQTDRFKETNKWELVLYKSFLSALLSGDEADATRKLAKLPPAGGKTPAFQYAQAALAFNRKDAVNARKTLAAAQTGYPPALNELFTSSLEVAGWQAPPPASAASLALSPLVPPTAASIAGITNPANLYLPPAPAGGTKLPDSRPTVVIDPKLEASAAEPLPAAPGREVHPVLAQTTAATHGKTLATAGASPNVKLPDSGGTPRPASPALSALSDSALERGGLLLGSE